MSERYLEFIGIMKKFPGVLANDGISLVIKRGEIHSLLGENGAGKTTLMNILYGLYVPDGGSIRFKGEEIHIRRPRQAIEMGVGMIHQHFMLIPIFTVLENIVLGLPSLRPPLLEVEKHRQEITKLTDKFGLGIDLDTEVGELSVGIQQKVEIVKALYKGAEILILDEPTSVLTPQESQELFQMLMDLKAGGKTIVFISHKLNEVMQISDRITVLRDGKKIGTLNKDETDPKELSRLMVGREVKLKVDRKTGCPGEHALRIRNLSCMEHDGRLRLKDISFNLCSGEILGIAGVDGNGQMELAEVIGGMRAPSSGSIVMFGEDVTDLTTRKRLERGLSHIPADRRKHGLVVDFNILDNSILEDYYRYPFTRPYGFDTFSIHSHARNLIKRFDVRTPGTRIPARNLSGGNQQKLVVGRELSKDPRILVVVQPTWGLDIAACEFVYRTLIEEREKQKAILLISTDLEEVRALSDRILVMYEGKIAGEVDPDKAKPEEIGLLMSGGDSHQ